MAEAKKESPNAFPRDRLTRALQVGQTILTRGKGSLPDRETLATAMGVKHTTGSFKSLVASAKRYGMISAKPGGPLELTEVGRSILQPIDNGEKERGLVEAFLKPWTFRSLWEKYKGGELPNQEILARVADREFGVKTKFAAKCAEVFTQSGQDCNLIVEAEGALRCVSGLPGEMREELAAEPAAAGIAEEAGPAVAAPFPISVNVQLVVDSSMDKDQLRTLIEVLKAEFKLE